MAKCIYPSFDAVRYMVGIAGPPGSGKSTTAKAVCSKINKLRPRVDKHSVAVVVGMDGTLRSCGGPGHRSQPFNVHMSDTMPERLQAITTHVHS